MFQKNRVQSRETREVRRMSYAMYGLLILGTLLGVSGAGLFLLLRRDPKDMYSEPDFPNILYRY